MGADDWIIHKQSSDGAQAITYHPGITTAEEAKSFGYKDVAAVFASGTAHDTGTGEQFNFQANGQYSIDGNSMSVSDGSHTTEGGTVIAENPIGRVNLFTGGLSNTVFGILGTIGATLAIPETGGASGVALPLTIGEASIGLAQMADSFSSVPSATLHDYSTIPGLAAGQAGSQYAPIIDASAALVPGTLSGGNILGTYQSAGQLGKTQNVMYNGGTVMDGYMDMSGFGQSLQEQINKPKN